MFAFAPLRQTLPDGVSKIFPKAEALDDIGITEFDVTADDTRMVATGKIAWLKGIEFELPGLDEMSIALLEQDGLTEIEFEHQMEPNFDLVLRQLDASLRIKTNLLQRVHKTQDGKWTPEFDVSGNPKRPEILVSAGEIHVDSDWEVSFVGAPAISFPPVMLGSTGIVLEVQEATLYVSSKQPAPQPGFKGVSVDEAAVYFTGDLEAGVPQSVTLTDALIGSSGFSGKIAATWTAEGGSGTLFGIPFTLQTLMVEFRQNTPINSSIKGTLSLPFFDTPVNVEIRYGADGGLLVRIDKAVGQPFYTFEKPNVLKMDMETLTFAVDGGVFTTRLSGQLTPLLGANAGLQWPTFDVRDLSIDSKGHVHLAGGWMTLSDQKFLDFHGFKIEITQLGFGHNSDGSKWVGFSGGLQLVNGLQAGASVEGLRITWFEGHLDEAHITLNGVGVELTIPGVLHLKGDVSYRELTDGSEIIHRFDGDIKLELETPELNVDGTLVIGSAKGPQGKFNFLAIYVDAEIPTGIAIASTGLSIYDISGLFALQMEPDKKPGELWFSIDHSKSYFHRPQAGMIDIKSKWAPRKGSFALGAGITVATTADDGYSLNGKFLLGIVLPGPIIFLQGAASILKKRSGKEQEGELRALAIYDGRGGTLTFGVDAEYKSGKGGELIEIAASMEAFYAFHDPMAWHLWIGKDEPRSLRVRALFARIVEANAYFMLDAHALALGAWYGYNAGWHFGPLAVRLEAWADGNAKLSFKPTQFHGDLWIHGLVDLEAFGFGLGISLDARIAADLFHPFHLRGEFSVGIKLPWPLNKKKIGATVVLEWGPDKKAPPLPLPLSQVAIESLKITAVWPLPRGKYLLPNWDDGGGFIAGSATNTEPPLPDFTQLPLAPLDARISLTFGRSVHDVAQVGVNLQPVNPDYEEIGNPVTHAVVAKARYSLRQLELNRWNGTTWQLVAHSPQSGTTPTLFGAWMPATQGQTKLLVGSTSGFDFTRATGSSWEEWVSDALPNYPCIPLLPSQETCFGFAPLVPGTQVTSPWTHHGPPDITLSWGFGPATVEMVLLEGGASTNWIPVLCFPTDAVHRGVTITSSEPGRSFRIVLAPGAQPAFTRAMFGTTSNSDATICADLRNNQPGTLANPWTSDNVRFVVHAEDGSLLPQGRVERWGQSPLGINAGFLLEIELPCASPWVELIVTHRPPFRILALNAAGATVAAYAPFGTGAETTETIRLEGTDITRVEVHAGGNEKLVHSVCYQCTKPTGTTGTGYDDHGHPHGPFVPIDGTIDVTGPGIGTVVIGGGDTLCIQKICITPDPEAGQAAGRDEMIEHIREELVRWHDEGPVLAPNSVYQLKVSTLVEPVSLVSGMTLNNQSIEEHAYFRTEGPPGVTKLLPPDGMTTSATNFDSGLDDLTRYVRETDPPTVPPPGERPILYRPFYRAYDVGVEFNENYVEQMYRMDGRDLGLYLFDNSNQPVRDANGAILLQQSTWGTAETTTLSESDTHWITLVNAATCLPDKLDPQTLPHASTIASAVPARVLAPDTLHEARLVPLLLHESFAELPLGNVGPQTAGWYAEDSGAGGPSQWQIGEVGAPPSRFAVQQSPIGNATPDRDGTLLLRTDSSQWTDYRVTAYARSDDGGAIGIVVRHQGPGTGYRFSLDNGGYQKKRDYQLSVEAIGSTIRAYVDGEQVFEMTDTAYAFGRIGLYVCGSPGARFADVSVDDLRKDAPVVYRFQLTTSLFANFFHHVHSFQDEVWSATLAADPAADAAINLAVAPSFTPPDEAESRAFETLADKVLGPAAHQNAARVEITRVERSGADAIYLVRGPEPMVPARTEIALSRSDGALPAGVAPQNIKLTAVENDAVSLLLRDGAELTRHRVELKQFPGAVDEPMGDPVLWLETFADEAALDRLTIVDSSGASQWSIEHGGAVELSGIGGGNEPELPGSHLIGGDPEWTDYRVTADLRADAGGGIGLLLRYVDESSYYRLSLGATLPYRRLVKCVGDAVTVLWDDASGYTAGEPFTLALEAVGSRLTGFLGDTRLFSVTDDAIAAGRAGVYVSANEGARCERIEVRTPSLDDRSLFADVPTVGDLAGDAAWTDVIVQARVNAAAGEVGLVVRAADLAHFYRFSISDSGRQFIKQSGTTVSVLWQDNIAYEPDRTYELTIVAVGSALRGFIDDVLVLAVADNELAAGRIALYGATGVFSDVRVWPAAQAFDGWTTAQRWNLIDDTGAPEPDWWTVDGGALHPAAATPAMHRPSAPPDKNHYAISTQPEAADMRLTANLTVDPNAGAGVLFAWKDVSNHMVFWLDTLRGNRRLERTENGAMTVVWQDSVAPAARRPYSVNIDQSDGRFTIHVDGVPIVALDLAVQSGSVGFAVHIGGTLTSLSVAEPQWVCWRGFGEEPIRPPGTVLRVTADASLRIGDGAALRVVGPDGVAQHTRTFRADSAYTPLVPRVLRKADGTAFFLIPPPGTPQSGSMRLSLTYHRARPEAGRPMSQAGDRTPEVAAIDF